MLMKSYGPQAPIFIKYIKYKQKRDTVTYPQCPRTQTVRSCTRQLRCLLRRKCILHTPPHCSDWPCLSVIHRILVLENVEPHSLKLRDMTDMIIGIWSKDAWSINPENHDKLRKKKIGMKKKSKCMSNGTGQGVWRSKRHLLAYHTRRKCS